MQGKMGEGLGKRLTQASIRAFVAFSEVIFHSRLFLHV